MPGGAPQVCYSGQLRAENRAQNRRKKRVFFMPTAVQMPGRLGAGAHRDTHAGAGGECLRHLTPSPRSEKLSKFMRKTAGTPSREKNSPREKRRRGRSDRRCAALDHAERCRNWARPAGAKRERGQLLILRSGTRSGEVFSFCAVAALQTRCRRFRGIVRIHPRGRRGALRPRRSGARWFPG